MIYHVNAESGLHMATLGRPPGSKAHYEDIASKMEREISEGKWRQGDTLPSRRQLANQYGVGEKVIRLALKTLSAGGVISQISQQKWKVAPRGIVVSSRTNLVALVLGHSLITHWTKHVWAQAHRGIEMAMSNVWDPLLIVHGNTHVLRKHVPPDLKDEFLRGIILAGPFTRECLVEYSRLSVPTVLFDQPPGKLELLSVCSENYESVRDAMKRLFVLGHRRIAFGRRVRYNISDIDWDSRERQQAFLDSAKELEIKDADSDVFNFFPDRASNLSTLKKFFTNRKKYTAILAVDPDIAELLGDAAKECGCAVGHDLSIVCFDALGAKSPWAGPRIDFERMGKEAVGMLDQNYVAPRVRRIPAVWQDGASVGKALPTS